LLAYLLIRCGRYRRVTVRRCRRSSAPDPHVPEAHVPVVRVLDLHVPDPHVPVPALYILLMWRRPGRCPRVTVRRCRRSSVPDPHVPEAHVPVARVLDPHVPDPHVPVPALYILLMWRQPGRCRRVTVRRCRRSSAPDPHVPVAHVPVARVLDPHIPDPHVPVPVLTHYSCGGGGRCRRVTVRRCRRSSVPDPHVPDPHVPEAHVPVARVLDPHVLDPHVPVPALYILLMWRRQVSPGDGQEVSAIVCRRPTCPRSACPSSACPRPACPSSSTLHTTHVAAAGITG